MILKQENLSVSFGVMLQDNTILNTVHKTKDVKGLVVFLPSGEKLLFALRDAKRFLSPSQAIRYANLVSKRQKNVWRPFSVQEVKAILPHLASIKEQLEKLGGNGLSNNCYLCDTLYRDKYHYKFKLPEADFGCCTETEKIKVRLCSSI